ncbi:hypothetical protein [Ornithinimicrobium kibberense]|uniref:hypothetical protein n=1 Tax=Ornithinimicrobium kibberense TaxID=282060 RepID=UPI003612B502
MAGGRGSSCVVDQLEHRSTMDGAVEVGVRAAHDVGQPDAAVGGCLVPQPVAVDGGATGCPGVHDGPLGPHVALRRAALALGAAHQKSQSSSSVLTALPIT